MGQTSKLTFWMVNPEPELEEGRGAVSPAEGCCPTRLELSVELIAIVDASRKIRVNCSSLQSPSFSEEMPKRGW